MYIVDTASNLALVNGTKQPLAHLRETGRLYRYIDDTTTITGDASSISADIYPHYIDSSNENGGWWDGQFACVLGLGSNTTLDQDTSNTHITGLTEIDNGFKLYNTVNDEWEFPSILSADQLWDVQFKATLQDFIDMNMQLEFRLFDNDASSSSLRWHLQVGSVGGDSSNQHYALNGVMRLNKDNKHRLTYFKSTTALTDPILVSGNALTVFSLRSR